MKAVFRITIIAASKQGMDPLVVIKALGNNYISALRLAGYDGVLSIEHEDRMLGTREGIQKSVSFLKSIILRTLPV